MSLKLRNSSIGRLVIVTLIALVAVPVFSGVASAAVPRGQCDLYFSGVYFRHINNGWKAIGSGSAECSVPYLQMRVILYKNGSVYEARSRQWSRSWDSQDYTFSVRAHDPGGRQKYRAVTRIKWVDQFGRTHRASKWSTVAYF